MNDSPELEKRYRRLLALYPRSYRSQNEEEILGVLLDTAREGQRRPGVAASADLIRAAAWLGLRPELPRSAHAVRGAIRLMCIGAVLEAAALVTYLVTASSVRSVMLRTDPAQWPAVLLHIRAVEIGGPLLMVLWLWLAWANGRGKDAARRALIPLFGLTTLGFAFVLATGGVSHSPADLIVTGVVWLFQLMTLVLVFLPASGPYYRRQAATG